MNNKYYINDKLAEYKNEEYIKLFSNLRNHPYDKILKTDLYEEAYGKEEALLSMSNKYDKFFGIDISYDIVNNAKLKLEYIDNNLKKTSQCLVADVRGIPFKENTFDLVISPSTLDHFLEIDVALNEIYRILKPGGTFAITLNNRYNFLFVLNSYFLHALGILSFKNFHYSPKGIKNVLESNGFFIKDKRPIVHIPFLFPTVSNFLQYFNTRYLNNLDSFCMNLIKKYSSYKTVLHYISGWFIAVIAEKYQ